MTSRRAWVTSVCLLASVASMDGQVRIILHGDDRLKGITEVDVVVAVTGDATPACAVSRPALQTTATEMLRKSRVRATVSEKASSWHYTVHVTVHTATAGDGCASAVTTELVAQVEGFPEADKFAAPGAWGSVLMGPMSLARENDLVTSGPREHDAAVQAAARDQLSALAERIRLANP
jgi:hypothetical protein